MNWAQLRWALLLVFLVPVVDPEASFTLADNYEALVGLMFLSLAACALVLSRLDRPPREALWAWVLLGLMIQGYYLRSYALAREVSVAGFLPVNPELNWVSIHTIAGGFAYITLAFSSVCLSCWVGLTVFERVPALPEPAAVSDSDASRFVLAVAAAGLAVGVFQAWYGFGVMGVESQRLPFRADTLLIRLRTDVVPALLYLAVWRADRTAGRRVWLAVWASMAALAVADSVLSTSRGSLVKLGLPVLFLWLVTGRFTRRRSVLLGAAGALAVLMYPFASAMRSARMSTSEGTAEAAAGAVAAVFRGDLWESAGSTTGAAADRVTGADGVWFAMGDMPPGVDVDRLLRHVFAEPIHVYYTREIVGVTRPADFRSPGLAGFAMLVGGLPALAVFPGAFALAAGATWTRLARLRSAPVALSLFAFALFSVAMEGTFTVGDLAMPFLAVAAVEAVYRRSAGGRAADAAAPGEFAHAH